MHEELRIPRGGDDECKYARVDYGMTIILVLIGFVGGVLTGIYFSVPLTSAACRNITETHP